MNSDFPALVFGIMQQKSNKEYISGRRHRFIWSALAIVLFGAILYFVNFIQNYIDDNDLDGLGGLGEMFYENVKADLDMFPEGGSDKKDAGTTEYKSANLLKVPLLLNCAAENGKIVISEPFEIGGRKISNAVFDVAMHGNTLYSSGFSSDDDSILCKGTMKEGGRKFFVYFCEMKK